MLQKMKEERAKLREEHLKASRGDRGDSINKVKIDLLEVYKRQMDGSLTLDNKQVHEITTSTSEEEEAMAENEEELLSDFERQ